MTSKVYKGLEDESMDTEDNHSSKNPSSHKSGPEPKGTGLFDSNRDSISETESFPSNSIVDSSPSRIGEGRLNSLGMGDKSKL